MKSTRLIVAIFAALAMTVLTNARFAFAQDADTPDVSADSGAVADSGTSADASWERSGPAIDEDAAAADKVLEIPQAPCAKDPASAACASSDDGSGDDGEAINAPSPGAPPQPSFDDDTASNGATDPDWGTVDEYQNQQVAVPYAVYPYPYAVTTGIGTIRTPSSVPASAYAPMSSPITQAAQPPLHQGPWMTPPTMSAFGRPAGSPMMMSGPSLGFHR